MKYKFTSIQRKDTDYRDVNSLALRPFLQPSDQVKVGDWKLVAVCATQ
jgi:hypothetical protein